MSGKQSQKNSKALKTLTRSGAPPSAPRR